MTLKGEIRSQRGRFCFFFNSTGLWRSQRKPRLLLQHWERSRFSSGERREENSEK